MPAHVGASLATATTVEHSACARALSVPELLDLVIDYLEGHFRDLKAASVVCKTLSRSTDRHIFKCLKLCTQDQLAKDKDIHPPDVPHWFVLNSYPRIVDNVRELTMLEAAPLRGETYMPTEVLLRTLDMFPRLQTLRMHYVAPYASLPDGPLHTPPGSQRKLACMEVIAVNLKLKSQPVPLSRILSLFSHLDNLTYWQGPDATPEDPSDAPQASCSYGRPQVHGLTLHWLANGRGLSRLGQAIDVSKLHTLTLQVHALNIKGTPAPFINAFLTQHSPPLQHIHINLYQCTEGPPRSVLGRVSDFVNERTRRALTFAFASTPLRSVRFSFALLFDLSPLASAQNTAVWEALVDSMGSTPASLSQATIILCCRPYATHIRAQDIPLALHALNWARLEHVLETRTRLHGFDIYFDTFSLQVDTSFRDEIRAALPAQIARSARFSD